MMINYNHTVFVFLLLSLGIFKLGSCSENNVTVKCIKSEREALVRFKEGVSVNGIPGKLSSWVGEDCCQWKGVECNNGSGHVTKLNLSNPAGRPRHFDYYEGYQYYSGNPNRAVCVYCRADLPVRGAYDRRSKYARLLGDVNSSFSEDVNASLSGEITRYLGNLSSLTHLDLGGNYNLSTKNLDWVSSLSSLKYLYMGGVKINHTKADWLYGITMLPSLLELSLYSCELKHLPSSLTFLNLTSLRVLDLSYNPFNTSIPQWLFNLTNLTSLDLTHSNQIGKILGSFGRLGSLKYLYLGVNNFSGSIPASIGNLSSLKELDLSYNKMNGTIPESFGQLSKLVKLFLLENSWDGVITEAQLMNLRSLEEFMLTTNNKSQPLVFDVKYDWRPPFNLKILHLESCLIGPKFPVWLHVQSNLTYVTLSNVGVGTIPEEWFSMISSNLTHLDLSNNHIEGNLPHQLVFPNVTKLFLQSNLFSGPIPSNISDLMPSLQYLDLSENRLYGKIPLSISKIKHLNILVLRRNNLSGELPHQWNESQKGLRVVDISYNNICGKIPSSMGFLGNLSILVLSNNNLSGEIPSSLQNCSIVSMDFGGNHLSGILPSWIDLDIFMLRLRSNLFSGTIPPKWCNLHKLRILDLAQNNLFGGIPDCLNNFTAMVDHNIVGTEPIENYTEKASIMRKGREMEYDRTLHLVTCIDLSGNNLTGGVPFEITSLTGLDTLNLSMNHLSGNIPENIGNLSLLETLDFSNNKLFGPIPESMSSLTFLVKLNLSFNNLTGRIPSGNQLQTINDATMYKGNPLLCGSPLLTKCPGDETFDDPTITSAEDKQNGDDYERIWFYASIGLGFVVGFWSVCGTILLKKSWRHRYFRFCDDIKDRIALLIALKVVHLKRKFGLEKS
ncbi:receptor-like protein EIX1 isoform X2 [Quercus lobata]|uniref:Leucine-rich repeat-containing N-terminal plant-type domain-containing protein n=1 Tax=Quercus lobata TaxID=97700 RepID=A0A7N2LPI1_QUELO|nr:receptor-like protein EIX1 isoform X2 [Quercus lobata]